MASDALPFSRESGDVARPAVRWIAPIQAKEKARSCDRAFGARQGRQAPWGSAGGYLNLKFATCVVPSASFSCNWRQPPAQDFSVFQT